MSGGYKGGYRHGDFLRVCDRTGSLVYASETKKEWTGLIVREDVWEPRHPQDFVRGIKDKQAVPEPRPEPTGLTSGPLQIAFASDGNIGDTSISVTATEGLSAGDTLQITLDGRIQETTFSSSSGGTATGGFHITIGNALKGTAERGYSIVNKSNVTTATDTF